MRVFGRDRECIGRRKKGARAHRSGRKGELTKRVARARRRTSNHVGAKNRIIEKPCAVSIQELIEVGKGLLLKCARRWRAGAHIGGKRRGS